MSQDFSFLLCLALAIHKYATIERIGHGSVITHVNSWSQRKTSTKMVIIFLKMFHYVAKTYLIAPLFLAMRNPPQETFP